MTFITLEGGEGVGKTTQRKLLEERLPQLYPDQEFLFTREPGGSPFAEALRDTIFSKLAADADGKTMFGLFAAARADHIRRVIRPALAAGKVVICDRFAAATYTYQGCAMENAMVDTPLLLQSSRRNLTTVRMRSERRTKPVSKLSGSPVTLWEADLRRTRCLARYRSGRSRGASC